jgi:hypothetical protein
MVGEDLPRRLPETAANVAPAMVGILIRIAPERIALFKAIIESYDNLATMRTEDPARHNIRLWFDPASADDVERILDGLGSEFGLKRIA